MRERTFEDRYQENDIPWDHTHPDCNLIDAVRNVPIQPCRVLDLGCGTGINAAWLAGQGFEVTGLDLSHTAIAKATARAKQQSLEIEFLCCNFLKAPLPGQFDFIFDRGCLHCFIGTAERKKGAERIADRLIKNGLWLSLIGNADDLPREVGPPTLAAGEITEIVEPHFEIVSLTAGCFGGEQEDPPKAWICLMKKRS